MLVSRGAPIHSTLYEGDYVSRAGCLEPFETPLDKAKRLGKTEVVHYLDGVVAKTSKNQQGFSCLVC